MRQGETYAISYHMFEFNAADKFHEFEPTVEDVTNALPEELKEMMDDPRYTVTVEEREDAHIFGIWIDAQNEFFKAKKRVEAEDVDV